LIDTHGPIPCTWLSSSESGTVGSKSCVWQMLQSRQEGEWSEFVFSVQVQPLEFMCVLQVMILPLWTSHHHHAEDGAQDLEHGSQANALPLSCVLNQCLTFQKGQTRLEGQPGSILAYHLWPWAPCQVLPKIQNKIKKKTKLQNLCLKFVASVREKFEGKFVRVIW
jgi:hypothetical protein